MPALTIPEDSVIDQNLVKHWKSQYSELYWTGFLKAQDNVIWVDYILSLSSNTWVSTIEFNNEMNMNFFVLRWS